MAPPLVRLASLHYAAPNIRRAWVHNGIIHGFFGCMVVYLLNCGFVGLYTIEHKQLILHVNLRLYSCKNVCVYNGGVYPYLPTPTPHYTCGHRGLLKIRGVLYIIIFFFFFFFFKKTLSILYNF